MSGYRRPLLTTGPRTHESLQAEVLRIESEPNDYSGKKHLLVALDNTQAVVAAERGWNVRVAPMETVFLGKTLTEHVVFLTFIIPESFDTSKFDSWRMDAILNDDRKAIIEFDAERWTFTNPADQRSGVRLFLTEIYAEDLEVEEKTAFNDYETYVQGQRDANKLVFSKKQWERFYNGNARPGLSLPDYENLNNRQRTVWVIGEKIGMFGRDYIISSVTDLDDQWGIRADRKYCESLYFRVPK